MPTYEYQCEKCGFEFEREQRITEDPIKTCPKCKSRKAKRLLSAPGFILKGGGWYADGYGSRSASASGSESGDSGSESSADSKSESKSGTSEGAGGESKSKPKAGSKSKKSAA
jgi:putative FmdB family regulatory protein